MCPVKDSEWRSFTLKRLILWVGEGMKVRPGVEALFCDGRYTSQNPHPFPCSILHSFTDIANQYFKDEGLPFFNPSRCVVDPSQSLGPRVAPEKCHAQAPARRLHPWANLEG